MINNKIIHLLININSYLPLLTPPWTFPTSLIIKIKKNFFRLRTKISLPNLNMTSRLIKASILKMTKISIPNSIRPLLTKMRFTLHEIMTKVRIMRKVYKKINNSNCQKALLTIFLFLPCCMLRRRFKTWKWIWKWRKIRTWFWKKNV